MRVDAENILRSLSELAPLSTPLTFLTAFRSSNQSMSVQMLSVLIYSAAWTSARLSADMVMFLYACMNLICPFNLENEILPSYKLQTG